MATQIMSTKSSKDLTPTQRRGSSEPSVRNIIASARSAPAPAIGAVVLSGLTAALMWAAFTPLDWGPLGWICLVPLIVLIRLDRPTRLMYRVVYLSGFVNSLVMLQWMRLGDPSMYIAWVVLSIYMGLYFPVFVGLSRVAVQRFSAPLTLAVPAVWVGLEYLRAHLMTGFAWYFLGHTQYAWIDIIQISDIFGAYGVSFLLAMMSACVAGLLPRSLFAKWNLVPKLQLPEELRHLPDDSDIVDHPKPESQRRQVVSVVACLSVFAAALGYGIYRYRIQEAFVAGPRFALIQGNFSTSLKHDPNESVTIFRHYDTLTGFAVKHQPDIIVWPETMFRWPLRYTSLDMTDQQVAALVPEYAGIDSAAWAATWRDPTVRQTLTDMSKKSGAAMLIGIDTMAATPAGLRRYNSVVFLDPNTGIRNRYDKLHRVVFGEYIPLRDEIPWLYKLTPFPPDYGIFKGNKAAVFDYKGWKLAPVICFEDTVPHLVRQIVRSDGDQSSAGKVDCLVNLTNDGWFHGSSELDQHLITAAFRAVECRTPMVRAVNTGISAVIDGNGVVREPDVFIDADGQDRKSMRDKKTGCWHKQLNAVVIDTVPLDTRRSLYVEHGDWFAGSCCFSTVFLFFVSLTTLRRRRT